MAPEDPPDLDKRATLRSFAAVGAVGPFAAAGTAAERGTDITPRRAIREHVERVPGVHFSGLRDALDLGTGETQYHLRELERDGRIESHADGDYRRLFPARTFTARERTVLSALRRGTHGGVILTCLTDAGATAGAIADRLDVSTPAVSRAAGDLEERGLLERAGGSYSLTDPSVIAGVIARAPAGFTREVRTAAARVERSS